MNDDTHDSGGDDLTAVRDLVLRAHPDTVSELIAGNSISALLASVEPAREAYRRVLDTAQTAAGEPALAIPTVPAVPSVPAGAAPALAVDPDRLPSTEKIRRGLAARTT